jgi:demethylmenaquinone methyltransferase/2-methoxy-6-polyprenyl-1,4-benzoquinol methylase
METTGRKHSRNPTDVRSMFARIARNYDRLNRVMSLGQDERWRRETVDCLEISSGARILDIGAGTGDLSFALKRKDPGLRCFACDLTPEMIGVGRQHPGGDRIHWVVADALHLPFSDQAFDGVVSGYLLRNVPDLPAALREQERVLTPGGSVAALDTTPPRKGIFRPLILVYLLKIIPLLGKWIAGDADAYTYLPETTAEFLPAERLADQFRLAGFERVRFVRRMLGSMAIHSAHKPRNTQTEDRPRKTQNTRTEEKR